MSEPKFYILDERDVWHEAISGAAREYGFDPKRIRRGAEVKGPGFGFIRTHATPKILAMNQADYEQMAKHLVMIQDRRQVQLYENKTLQFQNFSDWMPETARLNSKGQAMAYAAQCGYPIVSKADVGASSVNIRIIKNKPELEQHIKQVFGPGVKVQHCDSKGTTSLQNGYVLLQQFIPHEITYRVNVIGNGRAIFKRFCYPDRQVAQTGNVAPAMSLNDEMESLLDFADRFAEFAETKWCALDILKDGDSWRLLETSLAWPWPSPGDCNKAPIFRTDYVWADLFRCMFSEIMKGTFGGLDVLM